MLQRGLIGLFLLLCAHGGATAQALNASRPVEQLNEALLTVMRDAQTLGYVGRYEALAPVLQATFDFPHMARVATGRHWERLAPVQQEAFVHLFARMSTATLADRFNGYAGQRFEIGQIEELQSGDLVIRNRMVGANGKSTQIDYVVRHTDGKWRIVDVFLEGKFSEITVRRSEYTSILRRRGLDGLMSALDQQISRLEKRQG